MINHKKWSLDLEPFSSLESIGSRPIAGKHKKIWNIGVPNPASPYQADDANVYAELPGNCSNIALGPGDRLYVCCNVNDGAIFRAVEPAEHAGPVVV